MRPRLSFLNHRESDALRTLNNNADDFEALFTLATIYRFRDTDEARKKAEQHYKQLLFVANTSGLAAMACDEIINFYTETGCLNKTKHISELKASFNKDAPILSIWHTKVILFRVLNDAILAMDCYKQMLEKTSGPEKGLISFYYGEYIVLLATERKERGEEACATALFAYAKAILTAAIPLIPDHEKTLSEKVTGLLVSTRTAMDELPESPNNSLDAGNCAYADLS